MCGIFGQTASPSKIIESQIKTAGETISHRGPDDAGWFLYNGGFIANQRLSIIDLENGKQPFTSEEGRFSLVQNGEIYNFKSLKKKLITKGYSFKTDSDSEVLLNHFIENGINGLNEVNGMFCFAVRDNLKGTTTIVRDRVGIKPCFYSNTEQSGFLFSSEMRVIKNLSKSNYTVSQQSLYILMCLGYMPPPFTIYDSIHQLKPGNFIVVKDDGSFEEKSWWQLPLKTQPCNYSTVELENHIDQLVSDAVKLRTVADVPVGSYLSGGLDSSWISHHLQKHSEKNLKTFTLTFPNTNFDESEWATLASEKIQTEHFERKVVPKDLNIWNQFIHFCEQPHCDISFIPTFLVSELAAKHVKVVLTGDGGDEIFGGYNRYKEFFNLNDNASNEEIINLHLKQNRILQTKDITKTGLFTASEAKQFEIKLKSFYTDLLEYYSEQDNLNRALIIDVLTLLPGNNLVKPDRMGMAHSIEARTPLLDPNLLDFLFSLPGTEKANPTEIRTLQKNILRKYFSDEFVDRDKHMLTVPITDWKKDKLTNLADSLKLEGPVSSKVDSKYFSMIKKENSANPHSHLKTLRLLSSLEKFETQFL